MPARSLSSQSYRGLPLYNARKGVVAEKIRSLGRIIRRSDSSSHSTTASEFPTRLEAKERRRQARDPYELHSESVASSPLFNSPSSESARTPVDTSRGIFDPLVRAGTLLATAELDRLSFLANSRGIDTKPSNEGPSATSSGTSSKVNNPPNTPATCLGSSSATASPLPQTDGVLTPAVPTLTPAVPTLTPAVPTNTPASDLATPTPPSASHSTNHGHRRRVARSRLSEVYAPDDASGDIQQESGSESGSVIASSPYQSKSVPPAGKGADMCERHDIYHSLVPKPLSMTPSPPKVANDPIKPNSTARLDSSSSKGLAPKKLDIERLNELLDNAISDSLVTQRLIASTSTASNPAGAHFLEVPVLGSSLRSQLKSVDRDARESRPSLPLGSVGIRPFIDSRASSPGPRRDRSTRTLSSLSAASPVVKKHMAKHVMRSTTPTESHAVPCMSYEWSPDHGDEPGDLDVFCPGTLADAPGHEHRTDSEAEGKRTNARRSTSGTVLVTEAGEASDGSSSGTESSDGEAPLADDGCPQEFANRLKKLQEQLHCTMPGTLPEEKDSVDC
ncbi:hypothetical protein CONLIGDRAFT_480204 [Coniochaeta ligniaria NRRL 30616]|uniref:Uncharacterized protein n=1 Tax=Coniochaeta ligniaria NRRL 30616 TaxID=1408157 RepID=A0A1J7JG35_9PEZI|nr:hypothetical protein CONLIGDRAFT_480204 [Coniochaeta ligniaria NRRL 30616]